MLEELRIRDLGVITDAALPLGPRPQRRHRRNRCRQDHGGDRRRTSSWCPFGCRRRSERRQICVGGSCAEARSSAQCGGTRQGGRRGEAEEFDGVAELLLARTVGADGRSRAYVGGRAAPVVYWLNWARAWWWSTASRTRSGSRAPPHSGTPWTGLPEHPSPRRWGGVSGTVQPLEGHPVRTRNTAQRSPRAFAGG